MSLEQIAHVEEALLRAARRLPEMAVEESLILRVLTLLGRDLTARMDQWLRTDGLTEIEFRALATVFAHGTDQVCPSDLGTQLAQSPANMTRITDVLVQRGLVTRHNNEQDRRRVMLAITAEGEQLMRDILPLMGAFVRSLFLPFSPGERKRLLFDLKRLSGALDATPLPHRGTDVKS